MSNPFAALLEDVNVEVEPERSTDSKLCLLLETIFGFTLNKATSSTRQLVYLEEQASTFPGRDLDLEILEHALFQRLFLSDPVSYVQNRNQTKDNVAYLDEKVISYLYRCYVGNIETQDDVVQIAVEKLIMRNVITALKQPDLYAEQELFKQLFNVLKEGLPFCEQFFDTIYNEFVNDEDGFDPNPFLSFLQVIHVAVANMTIMTMNPAILNIVQLFTSHDKLCEVFIDYCKLPSDTVGVEYANTILGAMFSISILPKTMLEPFNLFQNPLDQASNNSMENILHSNMNAFVVFVHKILLDLLKSNATVQSKTLIWLGKCLQMNKDRGKLWNAHVPDATPDTNTVSDGFMMTMGAALLKLCQPFCQPEHVEKVLKVDPTYCSVLAKDCPNKGIHLLDMADETTLLPREADDDTSRTGSTLCSSSYSFVSECFYMAHRAIDLGYKTVVEKLVRLNQEMARIERAYNDVVNARYGQNETVEFIKEKMSRQMGRYLTIKAALSEPTLLEMLFNLTSATCYWLCQVSSNIDISNKRNGNYAPLEKYDIHFPLGDKVPETLRFIPEFIIENTISYLVFLRRFNPKMFEMHGYEQMKPIMTFVLIYMGSPRRMKNPHLRARLAEGLEALLPFHKDEPPGLNTLGGFQREMLFKNHEHKKEIVRSLLEVFVGIEMTGQSVQFEQKFNYRRPMYMVMDYLWELPEHQQFFKMLAEEAEKNMEAVTPPLFLRFINLLMNDAVFLLDEALSNMSKLKEMLQARNNGDWEALSAQERVQNMTYLQHIGMIAKFDNILGRDTIKTIERLTSKITIVFTHSTMVDRVAAMLNYFLLNLVGPNQKNFKVKDQKEYSFEPAQTVLDICKIYVNLKSCESFLLAVSQDGRSYSPQLFSYAEDVLQRIGGGGLVSEVEELSIKVRELADKHQASEDVLAEAPDHFLDPIMSTLMMDPVILPSSKQTVDRTTIARHLLSDQTDPFNRSPLTMDQVVPNEELASEIKQWLDDKKVHLK